MIKLTETTCRDCRISTRGEMLGYETVHILNCPLHASAPALLEALEGAEDALTHTGPCQCCPGSSETGHEHGCLVLRIRAAIAQARGESNG